MGMTSVRLDDGLDREVQAAAAREGVSVSDFIRAAVRERAQKVLAEESLWTRIQPIIETLDQTDPDERTLIKYRDPVHEAYAEAVARKHGRQS